MLRLLVCTLLLAEVRCGLVRVPKIYNALISSDENLSPSHAYPIIEPVFRTTALGVAFPPIIVNPPNKDEENVEKKDENAPQLSNIQVKKEEREPKKETPQLSYHGSLYPVTYDPFFSYAYRNDFLFPTLPYIQHHPVYVDLKHLDNKKQEKEDVNPVINFKKNPEVPDVPPPPLPFREKEKQKSR